MQPIFDVTVHDINIVFDESGTNNNPGDRVCMEDFACVGLIASRDQIVALQQLDRSLQRVTRRPDYKHAHVRKSLAARTMFASGIDATQCALIVHYTAPRGMALEQDRFEAICLREIGPDPSGAQVPRRTGHENLVRVVRLMAGTVCFVMSDFSDYRVYWDRRSDADILATAWQETARTHSVLHAAPHTPVLSFSIPHDLRCLARLAGVVAGDVVAFFRVVAPKVFPLARDDLIARRRFSEGYRVAPPQEVARFETPLIQMDPSTSTPIPMVGGYYGRFLNGVLSFIHPSGRPCSLLMRGSSECLLLQTPD